MKVAERCAALDILSGGRLHVGFGKGGTQQEAGTFGYQLEDLPPMIKEAMYLIPRLWMEDDWEHGNPRSDNELQAMRVIEQHLIFMRRLGLTHPARLLVAF